MKKIITASEVSIQATCRGWMALDGWRLVKTDLEHLRGMGVQEKGMADDLFIRYQESYHGQPAIAPSRAMTQTLWIEWKSKTGRHGEHQREWQRAERARGALVWVSKQDFDPTIEAFQEHYRNSGLMRKLR